MPTGAENGFGAIDALKRGAARAGLTLVAGHRCIAEIRAARTLQDVAPDGRHVAELTGRREKQRLTHYRITLSDTRVPRDVAHSSKPAEAETAVRQLCDRGER